MNNPDLVRISDYRPLLCRTWTLIFAMTLVVVGCGDQSNVPVTPKTNDDLVAAPHMGSVTEARIIAADNEPGNWLSHGRTYDEQRFSAAWAWPGKHLPVQCAALKPHR